MSTRNTAVRVGDLIQYRYSYARWGGTDHSITTLMVTPSARSR